MKTVMVFGVFDGVSDSDRHVFTEALEFGDEVIAVVARDEIVLESNGHIPEHLLKNEKNWFRTNRRYHLLQTETKK